VYVRPNKAHFLLCRGRPAFHTCYTGVHIFGKYPPPPPPQLGEKYDKGKRTRGKCKRKKKGKRENGKQKGKINAN
jgi:hypothetical protein